MALARVVAQQEVETIAGWLHPSTAASSQKAAEVRNATADAARQDQSLGASMIRGLESSSQSSYSSQLTAYRCERRSGAHLSQ